MGKANLGKCATIPNKPKLELLQAQTSMAEREAEH